MSKKTLTIIIIVFVVIILGMLIGAFFVFRGPSDGSDGKGGLRDFFPFGKGENSSEERPSLFGGGNGEKDETSTDDTSLERSLLKLKQLTTEPVAGAVAASPLRGETTVRYIERTTGNAYEIGVANSNQKRLSNTTVPAVREAFFGEDGVFVNLRYLNENDVIKTFIARILLPGEIIEKEEDIIETNGEEAGFVAKNKPIGEQTTGRLAGTFLEDDITHMTISPNGEQFFYLMRLGTGIIGTIENFTDNKKNQIFDSPFTEWLPEWPEENTLALTTKASETADGFLYFLNIKTGDFEKKLGDIPGLTTNVNSDATAIFYSESSAGGFTTHILDIKDYALKKINVSTLPEKCVWSTKNTRTIYCGVPSKVPSGPYPDIWYQGIVSFSDNIWKINVDTNTIELLVIPIVAAEQEVDIINPFLGPNENYLFFTNKKDSTLWGLQLDR